MLSMRGPGLAEQLVGEIVTSPNQGATTHSMNSPALTPGGPMSGPRVVGMGMPPGGLESRDTYPLYPPGGLSLSSPHLAGPSPRASLQGSNAVLSRSQSRDPTIASASSVEEPPIDPDHTGVGIYLR